MGSQNNGIVTKNRREECAAGKQSSSKRQTTINGCLERQSAAAVAKDKPTMDVVESFMSANIPLEKLDNPKLREIFQNSLKGGGCLSNTNTLRQIYVEKVYNQQHNEILKKLADQKIAVIVDETTDMRGRYVVNVLMHPLDPLHRYTARLCW